jgi:hypothetical protein
MMSFIDALLCVGVLLAIGGVLLCLAMFKDFEELLDKIAKVDEVTEKNEDYRKEEQRREPKKDFLIVRHLILVLIEAVQLNL